MLKDQVVLKKTTNLNSVAKEFLNRHAKARLYVIVPFVR